MDWVHGSDQQTIRQIYRQAGRQADGQHAVWRQADRQTGSMLAEKHGQADRQHAACRQADRQAGMFKIN